MKRIFLIFLLVMLPFQMSWGAVASYCQHEEGKAAQHFGHHDHKHHASASTKQDKSNPGKIDSDCGYCHLSWAKSACTAVSPIAFPQDSTPVEVQLSSYLSHIPDGLIRPDWQPAS